VGKFWPIPEGKAMTPYWTDGKNYYVVLGEDYLEKHCKKCAKIGNMKFGWKKNNGVPLFVCTNIQEIQPTILEPIRWIARFRDGDCPFFEETKEESMNKNIKEE